MEKNILAYFKSPEQANEAAAKLKSLRVVDLSVDRFDGYPGEDADHRLNPIAGAFSGLGSLTADTEFSGMGAAILSASGVDASGMSDGGQGATSGRDILLTAVVEESSFDQAMKVIRDAGGKI